MANKRKVIFVAAITAAALAVITWVVWAIYLAPPSEQDYANAKDSAIKAVVSTQDQLDPLANAYIAAFKNIHDEGGSVEQAVSKTKDVHDAFKRSETKAIEALEQLTRHRVTNDHETEQAIKQLADVATARTQYFASITQDYAKFRSTFGGKDNTICYDVFIAQSKTFTERKEKLTKAVGNCYTTLNALKASPNPSYQDYGSKLEKRLRQMEKDANTAYEAEKKAEQYLVQKEDYEKRLWDAMEGDISDEEYSKLTAEIKATSKKIEQDNLLLSRASGSYVKAVSELPQIYDAVFSVDVLQKREHYKTLLDARLDGLRAVIDSKLQTVK